MNDTAITAPQATDAESPCVRVFLVDDHRMLLEGLVALLRQEKGLEIVGYNTDSRQALGQVRLLQPDVLVLDISMPGLDGIEFCRQIQKDKVRPAILMLSVHSDEQIVAQAIGAGASGYLLKEAATQDLARAIHQVSRGHFFLGEGIAATAIARVAGATSNRYNELSPREQEVLRLVVEGGSSAEVGLELGVGAKTVDTHKRRLMKKLGVENSMELVKFAIREGITRA